MGKPLDLSHIYSLRNDFTIIGLTGQIGSGCSEVAEQLSRGFRYSDFEDPLEVGLDSQTFKIKHNSYRKYRIVYNYAKENFNGFLRINYKDVLLFFLLEHTLEELFAFLRCTELKGELRAANLIDDFEIEIEQLIELKPQFEVVSEKYHTIKAKDFDDNDTLLELFNFFQSEFQPFCNTIHHVLKSKSRLKRNKVLQVIANNLRRSRNPFEFAEPSADKIFTIVEFVNHLIKGFRKTSEGKQRTQVVIDDLRNPIEVMYFKQRYAAFYTVAINRNPDSREKALRTKYNATPDPYHEGEKLWKEEYNGAKSHEFYKANISACIQQADIHISFLTKDEALILNSPSENSKDEAVDSTSPYFSWKMQLLKYVSLISHPGLVPPSPEERCMQMAYTAKHNSGCISRHVGAAITDENYSIKAIGWNNTPSGQVPCVLRNAEDLLGNKNDISAFTVFETGKGKDSRAVWDALDVNFRNPIHENRKNLKGRNVCFCFKDLKNSCSDGKNQVHTRSLHAEESAFLQITKYGGMGIENGKLFTTASTCELCAKKAYQLGIKVIYYIDPYPGISDNHILSSGDKPIKPRLFNGAIGNAYHWLYDPIMPYKDELTLLLGNKFDDYATKKEKEAKEYKKELDKKDIIIAELKRKLDEHER